MISLDTRVYILCFSDSKVMKLSHRPFDLVHFHVWGSIPLP